MFLQLAEGPGFPDQNGKVSSEKKKKKQPLQYITQSCHGQENNSYRIFITVWKELWENISKKKATDGG